jgi:hypothetical protein
MRHEMARGEEYLVMRGSKAAGLLDWQNSGYYPYSEAVSGVLSDRDFDPRDWFEGPWEQPFNPARSLEETFNDRCERYRDAGAERERYPDWDTIDQYGGPLCDADFSDDVPSDNEGGHVHMGYRDGVSKYADSDVELDDDDDGGVAGFLDAEDWYHRPVWKLMHEYILRGGRGNLTFGDAFRDPVAHWRDEFVGTLAGGLMSPSMEKVWALPRHGPRVD